MHDMLSFGRANPVDEFTTQKRIPTKAAVIREKNTRLDAEVLQLCIRNPDFHETAAESWFISGISIITEFKLATTKKMLLLKKYGVIIRC